MAWPIYWKHGDTCGGKRTRLYDVWITMRNRCSNPAATSYRYYGARGIAVCKEWEDFAQFKSWAMSAGYAPRLAIDRINVNHGYSPENCRWVTQRLNNRNKRNNRYITAFGHTKTLIDWVEDQRCTVSYAALKKRLNRGMLPEVAMVSPLIPAGKYPRKKKEDQSCASTSQAR